MVTETETQTKTKLTLDPPDVLQPIEAEQAAGLVPLKTEEKSQLEGKVDKFIDELTALDPNSPEYGKKVDQLTAMGRREIAEAAGASSRFLDRPIKAIDKETASRPAFSRSASGSDMRASSWPAASMRKA